MGWNVATPAKQSHLLIVRRNPVSISLLGLSTAKIPAIAC
jgi:hypothetical protein